MRVADGPNHANHRTWHDYITTAACARPRFSAITRGTRTARLSVSPNPKAAAKAILQAADKAIGANNVRSVVATGTGWMASPGQQYAQGDLPRADLKSYTLIRDFASKSQKLDYVRVQGNNPPRGGGGIPIQGEQRTVELVNGNTAWNLSAQGQPAAQPQAAADRQHLMLTGPVGFIRYLARQNRTVKVVGFKVCDGPQPQARAFLD